MNKILCEATNHFIKITQKKVTSAKQSLQFQYTGKNNKIAKSSRCTQLYLSKFHSFTRPLASHEAKLTADDDTETVACG